MHQCQDDNPSSDGAVLLWRGNAADQLSRNMQGHSQHVSSVSLIFFMTQVFKPAKRKSTDTKKKAPKPGTGRVIPPKKKGAVKDAVQKRVCIC